MNSELGLDLRPSGSYWSGDDIGPIVGMMQVSYIFPIDCVVSITACDVVTSKSPVVC